MASERLTGFLKTHFLKIFFRNVDEFLFNVFNKEEEEDVRYNCEEEVNRMKDREDQTPFSN